MKLGDLVEKITTFTGIKRFVDWYTGNDCNCDYRKERLNLWWDKITGKKNF